MPNRITTPRERISVDMPKALLERVDAHGNRLGISRNAALSTLLNEALIHHEVTEEARKLAGRARARRSATRRQEIDHAD